MGKTGSWHLGQETHLEIGWSDYDPSTFPGTKTAPETASKTQWKPGGLLPSDESPEDSQRELSRSRVTHPTQISIPGTVYHKFHPPWLA